MFLSRLRLRYDLAVIGAGPAGYVGAIRASQLGLSVCCVEKQDLGGTCLNVGCIPSKALLHMSHEFWNLENHFFKTRRPELRLLSVMEEKQERVEKLTGGIRYLFKKNKIDLIQGSAQFKSKNQLKVGEKTVEFSHCIVATGSTPIELPSFRFSKRIISSNEALILKELPKRFVVVGGGIIGLEIGLIYAQFGSQVTILEQNDEVCSPLDGDMRKILVQELSSKMKIRTGIQIQKHRETEDEVEIYLHSGEVILADLILVAVGRRPVAEVDLEVVGGKRDSRGHVETDDNYQVNESIFACGDCTKHGPQLAHKAEKEILEIVEALAEKRLPQKLDYDLVPNVVYTTPEVAWVGKRESECDFPVKVGKFYFSNNSRARAVGSTSGMVKIMTNEKDRIVGAHIVGEQAGNLLSPLIVGITYGATSQDIARVCFPHPTFSESIQEACLDSYDKPLHA